LNGSISLTLTGVAAGQAEVRVEQPEGFGPAGDISGALPVSVVLPELSTSCGKEMSLAKDTQMSCLVQLRAGVTVTATSQQPGLLLVSNDSKKAGSATTQVTSGSQGAGLTLQGLAAYGTAEVILTAPGYQDLRLPVVLVQTRLALTEFGRLISSLTIRKGQSASLTVNILGRETFQQPAVRAGATLSTMFSTSPAGIISLDPERVTFAEQGSVTVTVKGVAAGSTLLRLNPPEGATVLGSPIAVTVTP